MTVAVSISVAYSALSARPAQGAVSFVVARCPNPDCQRHLMSIPGKPTVEVREIADAESGSGRGRVTRCRRRDCLTWAEVIEHG